MTDSTETRAYPVAERAFHVVVRDRGEPSESFRAADRATLSSYPASDREDAYALMRSLNYVVAHHVSRASTEAEASGYERGVRDERERLSDILDTERYKVAIALQAIRKAIDGRRWLSEPGRGSYTYDDERYQQEFGGALDEIADALGPLRKIAGDWSDCPRDPLRVAANRTTAIRAGTTDSENDHG